jgi:tRNA dimethylallyltransferase
MSIRLQTVVIAGPTATGKTQAAHELAQQIGGEIVSVDSMQVYRGLDIGTCKPSLAERAAVPYHLIDCVELEQEFNAHQFCLMAKSAVESILRRRRIPILCGGTGLYFRTLFFGLGDAPSPDPLLRKELSSIPIEKLLEELSQADPELFKSIDRQNPRRIIRALEVIRLTGVPFSKQRGNWKQNADPSGVDLFGCPICWFGLERDRDELRQRIMARVDSMFARGLLAEIDQLIRLGLEKNLTASQALGYRQVLEYRKGSITIDQAIELTKQLTCQYAKRQMTWFRRQLPLEWINLTGRASAQPAVEIILERLRGGNSTGSLPKYCESSN